MLLVYTSHITARLEYIAHTLFRSEVSITDSKEKFIGYSGAKINYSQERITVDELFIQPHALLVETGIHQQNIHCFEWKGLTIFFKTGGDIPFDIFSAAFYLLSRYEEYLPHQLDEYGRYAHANSLAYKEGFLQLPLVNLWMKELEKVFPKISAGNNLFRFIPTYDIDIAYSYLHHSLARNVFGFYRDLLKGNFEKVVERGNVYTARKKDPFDTFEWLDALHDKYKLQPIYFFLTIIKRGEYDKNLPARSKALRKLYQRLSLKYTTGLHPSWQSGTEHSLLKKEIETLQNIIQKPVHLSRNHYLRFTIPGTYRRLIAAGITDDYSMAYASINGFRASYTLPYQWFDLELETATSLTLHPFCYMEANTVYEQKFSVEQGAEELQCYYDRVRSVNGEFISLFHNHFLAEQPQWLPWRKMYEDFMERNCS